MSDQIFPVPVPDVASLPASVKRPWWDRQRRPRWLRRVGYTADVLSDLVLLTALTTVLSVGAVEQRTAVLLVGAVLAVGVLRDVHTPDPRTSRFDRGLVLAEVLVVGLAVAIVGVAVFNIPQPMGPLLGTWALLALVLLAKRWAVNLIDVMAWRRGIGVSRILFAGAAGESGRRLMQAVVNDPRLGGHLVGYLSAEASAPGLPVATEHRIVTARRLGLLDDLVAVAQRQRVDEVIFVLDESALDRLGALVSQARAAGLTVRIAPDLGTGLGRATVSELAGVPVIGFDHEVMSRRGSVFKRVVDLVFAAVTLVVAAVPMLLIALLVRLDSPGPVILRQRRVGKNGRPFDALKFRTMVEDADRFRDELIAATGAADPRLFKHAADPRLTRVGTWLRGWSLDEFPQLWNIVRGEMSVVGPRPPLPEEVALYDPVHLQRLAVVPGLTGLWQVNGRSDLSFDEMVRLDLYYVETWSPWLDLKLIVRTLPAVIGGHGAY